MTEEIRTIRVSHQTYTDVEIAFDSEGQPIEPVCEGCSMSIKRQKCAFELGRDCPRHDQLRAFNMAKTQWLQGPRNERMAPEPDLRMEE